MPKKRVFSEQQVSEIIRRAAEHQARHRPQHGASTSGVSEDELRHVAEELGIDMESLVVAMSEVGAGGLDDTGTLDSVDRVLERSFEGEMSADDIGIVLQGFTPTGGIGNQTVTIGNTLSYQSIVGMSNCNVSVSSRSGKTTLHLKSSAFIALVPTFLPAVFLSFVTNMIIWEEIRPMIVDGLPAAILIPVALMTIAYFAFKKLVRYSNKKVLDLTNRTAAKIEESVDNLRGRITKSGIPLPEVENDVETRIQ